MADAGLNAIEKGLLETLNFNTLTSLLGAQQASIYNMLLPPGAKYPAVVIQLMDSNGLEGRAFSDSNGDDPQSLDYLVKGITKASEDGGVDLIEVAGDIAAAIDARLHRSGLVTATGWSIYHCSRQRWVRYIEHDEGRTPYVHSGAVYRVWAY